MGSKELRTFSYVDAFRHANFTWLDLAWTFLSSWTEGVRIIDPSTCPFWLRWNIGWKGWNAWPEVFYIIYVEKFVTVPKNTHEKHGTLYPSKPSFESFLLFHICVCNLAQCAFTPSCPVPNSMAWSSFKPIRFVTPLFSNYEKSDLLRRSSRLSRTFFWKQLSVRFPFAFLILERATFLFSCVCSMVRADVTAGA